MKDQHIKLLGLEFVKMGNVWYFCFRSKMFVYKIGDSFGFGRYEGLR